MKFKLTRDDDEDCYKEVRVWPIISSPEQNEEGEWEDINEDCFMAMAWEEFYKIFPDMMWETGQIVTCETVSIAVETVEAKRNGLTFKEACDLAEQGNLRYITGAIRECALSPLYPSIWEDGHYEEAHNDLTYREASSLSECDGLVYLVGPRIREPSYCPPEVLNWKEDLYYEVHNDLTLAEVEKLRAGDQAELEFLDDNGWVPMDNAFVAPLSGGLVKANWQAGAYRRRQDAVDASEEEMVEVNESTRQITLSEHALVELLQGWGYKVTHDE